MKKWILLCSFLLLFLCGCQAAPAKASSADTGVTVVASMFPQYDFARAILGEHGTVKMLLSPGMESHTYEPTPADMIAINRCDLFLYTGEAMESWAHELLEGLDNDRVAVCETAAGIELTMTGPSHDSDHDHHSHNHGHSYVYDPHVWTSPVNAMTMVETIRDAIIAVDPGHADAYMANAQAYLAELEILDASIRDTVSKSKRDKMVFAGRFALHYFVTEYGLDYLAAYDSCSSETEPSAAAVKEIVDTVKQERIPVVYCEELVDQRTASAIASEAGADVLVFHSCHNVSKEAFDAGETYLTLMKQNLVNLEKGLN